MSPVLTSDLISDWATFADLEPQWRSLWHRVPYATPFQSPAWLLAWWRAFAPGELNVLAVRSGDRLVALAPFYLEKSFRGHWMLPIGISVSDYHDVLIDPDFEQAAATALAFSIIPDHW